MFLFPTVETDAQGQVVVDDRDHLFMWPIHPGEVDFWNYNANRDEFLYHDITSQAEQEFDTILHQDFI